MCPARHWLFLPLWCPAGGGLLCLPSAYPAFSLLFCPLSPRPPSPAGKGEPQSLFRRGLRPRHPCIRPFAAPTATAKRAPRGQNPRGTGYPCRCGALRGAQGGGRLLILPLAFLFAPYPPSPVPRWGRGRIKVFLCKGLRPLHPRGLLRAALARRASAVPCGGAQGMVVGSPCPPMFPAGACLSPRLPTLLLALFLPPIPPAPFPGGEGGAPKFISPGASPPAPLH